MALWLSPAQERYLAQIRAAGPEGARFNGRARQVLANLERLGLIRLDFDLVLGQRTSELWTAVALSDADRQEIAGRRLTGQESRGERRLILACRDALKRAVPSSGTPTAENG
jgi:hypothetical protein